MPRLFVIRPGSLTTVLVSVDASQSIQFILSQKGLVLLEPGEFADELMGNALMLNSPAEFKLIDKLDRVTVGKYQTVYLVSTNPDCYVIRGAYCEDKQYKQLINLRTIVRMP